MTVNPTIPQPGAAPTGFQDAPTRVLRLNLFQRVTSWFVLVLSVLVLLFAILLLTTGGDHRFRRVPPHVGRLHVDPSARPAEAHRS